MAHSPLDIDIQAIKKLAALLKKSALTEIEYEANGVRIRVGRGHEGSVLVSAPAPVVAAPSSTPSAGDLKSTEAPQNVVTAPLVGVVYLTPQPGAAPFVQEGDVVQAGAQLLIIEAMKVMNPIRAPHAGRVSQIAVRHGDPVEFGAPLLTITPAGAA